jgi:hypothetical protein
MTSFQFTLFIDGELENLVTEHDPAKRVFSGSGFGERLIPPLKGLCLGVGNLTWTPITEELLVIDLDKPAPIWPLTWFRHLLALRPRAGFTAANYS